MKLHRLRDLMLAGGGHLSAASGLLRLRGQLFVVADDALHLGVLDADAAKPVRLLRLFDGELPLEPAVRKAAKPDLETLLELPALPDWPQGALLALGSGSRPNRQRGVLLAWDAAGGFSAPREIDLAPLYAPLRAHFAELNIEGGFILAGELRLLQRAGNACIRYDAAAFCAWLGGHAAAPTVLAIERFDLGQIDGVPLAFTDGAALPDNSGWVFSAVAENAADSYLDGPCLAAALGCIGADGALRWLQRLDPVWKVEGIAVQAIANGLCLTLVTDADDPATPAHLMTAQL